MNTLIDWLYTSNLAKDIQLTEFRLPLNVNLDITVYKCKLKYKNTVEIGWGYSEDPELALTKAVAEAIERVVFTQNSRELGTSNGLAVHTSIKKSAHNAVSELIERDAFLCHYLTKTPFDNCDMSSKDSKLFLSFKEFLSSHNIQIVIGKMRTINNHHGFICLTDGNKCSNKSYGINIGLGCAKDEVSAFNKSLLECAIQVFFYLGGGFYDTELDINGFNKDSSQNTVGDHKRLFLNNDYSHYIKRLFKKNSKKDFNSSATGLYKIHFKTFPMDDTFFDIPLKAVYAYSNRLQKLFFQLTEKRKLNLSRLSEFTNKKISVKDLEFFPHPLS